MDTKNPDIIPVTPADDSKTSGLGRRAMLQTIVAGVGAGFAVPGLAGAQEHPVHQHIGTPAAATAQKKAASAAYKPEFLDAHQLKTLDVLSEARRGERPPPPVLRVPMSGGLCSFLCHPIYCCGTFPTEERGMRDFIADYWPAATAIVPIIATERYGVDWWLAASISLAVLIPIQVLLIKRRLWVR
jgi:hypothetical protein